MAEFYAQVAVDLAVEATDRLYTYAVPDGLAAALAPGGWVEVPFGPRRVLGCYIAPVAAAPPGVTVRALHRVVAGIPPLPPALLELAGWVADRYLCPFVAALRLLLPAAVRRQQVRELRTPAVRLRAAPAAARAAAESLAGRAPAQARVLAELLVAGGAVPLAELARLSGGARAAIRALERADLLERVELGVRRDPFACAPVAPDVPPALTPAQAAALAVITAAGAGARPVLLHGVTGSGKTEVYLRAIAAAVEQGRQAIVLVPEIALTPQTVSRFRARFGDRVAVLHSGLGQGERFDEWVRIRRGAVDIVVGARSAVFAPVTRLGMILIDEEHESTYKQEEVPRYHTRAVAAERCRREGAVLVLGSATPAVETYFLSEQGRLQRVTLPHRVQYRPLPAVTLVDMRAELRAFNRTVFSQPLQAALRETCARGEQAILFLNRRGFSTFLLCRACGEAIGCPHCAVTLTLHLPAGAGASAAGGRGTLRCHYCDHVAPAPDTCPTCGSKQIRHLGAGTEKVEEELRRLLPGVRALRLDVDTTRRKGAHAEILGAFGRGEADVLVGTQMVAKGLDFAGVTLVGVVLADVTLHLPDFRAAERTFQLITQVAGRAGRGDRPGRVLVQTYDPEHFSLQSAARHDYTAFYAREIAWRREMGYPPFAELVRLIFTGEDPAETAAARQALAAAVAALPGGLPGEVLANGPAPLARLRGRHREHLLLRGPRRGPLVTAVQAALRRDAGAWRKGRQVRLTTDVGPQAVL